jgi:hypothetical protein
MRFSRAQVDVFEHQANAAFAEEVAVVLLREYPGAVRGLSGELLRRRIRYGIARARDRGLCAREIVAAYVTLMFVVTPGFDEVPLVAARLDEHQGAPDQAVARLLWLTSDDEWAAVRAGRTPGWPDALS